jgi:hypothetical protein
MPYVPPEVPPESLRAGDTIDFVLRLADTPPAEWTLAVSFRGPSSHDVAAVEFDGAFRITADTIGWSVGTYAWIARLTNIADPTQKHTAALSTDFELLTNLAVADAQDVQTHAAKMVAMLRATLEGTATQAHLMYRLPDGREVGKIPPLELHELLARYEARLGAENSANQVASGKRSGRIIVPRFS